MLRFVLCLIIITTAYSRTMAGENGATTVTQDNALAGLDPFAFFDASQAPRPKAGDWLEYRIAYPVDPLENSLNRKPIQPPRGEETVLAENAVSKDDDFFFFKPHFNPQTAWKSIPVRLEITTVDNDALGLVVSIAGNSYPTSVNLNQPGADDDSAKEKFHWDPPQPAPATIPVRLGGAAYEATEVRRIGSFHGFVRRTAAGVPFGLLRYASENLDVALVGFGSGTGPAFPLPDAEAGIEPPLGGLYTDAP